LPSFSADLGLFSPGRDLFAMSYQIVTEDSLFGAEQGIFYAEQGNLNRFSHLTYTARPASLRTQRSFPTASEIVPVASPQGQFAL
jgi:hypothetical protein